MNIASRFDGGHKPLRPWGDLPNGQLAYGATSRVLGSIGPLSVRLAACASEIDAAIDLRSRVFLADSREESGAIGRDHDRFDDYCDHLVVLDNSLRGSAPSQIVGTSRLLREEHAVLAGGFYSETEFHVSELTHRHAARQFLELGRSCVLPHYRSKRTMELLWQGIWAYCGQHKIDVMFGCASFPGRIPALHAQALSFLHHYALAAEDWQVSARSSHRCTTDLVPVEAVNAKAAFLAMPPLVKGYLRLGAKFGEAAVVDHEFGTTDVFVILRTEEISKRYLDHFGTGTNRFS